MIIFAILLGLIAYSLISLAVYTQMCTRNIYQRLPAIGTIRTVNGLKVHFVDRPAHDPSKMTVVYLHGASGNLRDPLHAFGDRLDGKVRQIFIDRPGHGWSERGSSGMFSPVMQAKLVLALLDELNVEKAIFVGHSWSGALIATLGVLHPKRVAGLLFSAPVSHPWPGGVNWYYHVAATPIFGWLFTRIITLAVGQRMLPCATDKVFWPNKVPDYYTNQVGSDMVLAPERFLANSLDIVRLRDHVVALSPRYHEIKAPTIVITGDKDQIVLPWVHSDGLERDIPGLKRIDLKNTGHMPHHVAPDIFADAVLELADLAENEEMQHLDKAS